MKEKPDEGEVLWLGECPEDETSSFNGLFHWQVEDYEVFQPKCNMLQIQESESNKGTQKVKMSIGRV